MKQTRRSPLPCIKDQSTMLHALCLVTLAITCYGSDWTGGIGNWSSDGSPGWNGTGIPNGLGTTANFPSSTTGTTTQEVVGIIVGTISLTNISNNSRTVTLTNGITLNQDGVGAGTATISNTNSFSGTTNALIFSGGTLTLADDLLITNTGNSTSTSGAIQFASSASILAGTGNITISNSLNDTSAATGAIRFSNGANTFSGNVNIKKGLVSFNNSGSFGGVAGNTITLGEAGQGSASLLATAGGLNIANNWTAASGSGGTLLLGSTSIAASTVTYSGTGLLNGDLSLTSANPVTGNGAVILSGNISGGGGIDKVGVGNGRLSGTNSYTGNTTVTSGVLQLGSAGAIAASPVVLNGGTLTSSFVGTIQTTGSLALNAGTSVLDFGSGVGNTVLEFGNSSGASWAGSLRVDNWQGSVLGGVGDQFKFTAGGLDSPRIAQVTFKDPSGFVAGIYGATLVNGNELVPVPEPAALLTSIVLAGTALFRRRRA